MYISCGNDIFADFGYYTAGKRQYETIKRRKKSKSVPILILIIAVVIVGGGALIGVFVAGQAVNNVVENSEVLIGASVSGDDIVVEIFDSPRSSDVVGLTISIEGYSLPQGLSTVPVTDGKVVYHDMAIGMSGLKQVSFKAQFSDGTSKTVWIDTLRFT